MLVVEARDLGRGRLLAVEPDVLDRCLTGPEAIFKVAIWSCDTAVVQVSKEHWVNKYTKSARVSVRQQ